MKIKYMFISVALLLALVITACAGCSPEDDVSRGYEPRTLDYTEHGYIAMQHIKFMNDNLYMRPPFTYRELETALWISDVLLEMGHREEFVEIQTFHITDVTDAVWLQRMVMFGMYGGREQRYYSQNVILTIPGRSEQVIVIGAHYDTVQYTGASDNASGVALLLESAQRMLYVDNYYTLVYVFFGAEEIGLFGAHHFVNTLTQAERDNIRFMINADVLFEGPYLLFVAGGDSEIIYTWNGIARELGYSHEIGLIPYPRGISMWMSDHIVFYQNGITSMMLLGMNSIGDSFDWRILHSPRDCFHYINTAWPGKMEQNMWAFSLFLEALLLTEY